MAGLRFTLFGQAASKANSRKIVNNPKTGRAMVIKSKEARKFMDDARRQIPPACRVRLQGPVAVVLHIHYKTERPDLDESIVLDAMQDVCKEGHLLQAGVYVNDRQVRWKLVVHHIDARNPRVEVEVHSIAPTQDMFALMPTEEPLPF